MHIFVDRLPSFNEPCPFEDTWCDNELCPNHWDEDKLREENPTECQRLKVLEVEEDDD